jgi:hypothetical protein
MTYLTVSSTPATASSSITGPTNVCTYLGNSTVATYTAATVSGTGVTYNWTAPLGATLVSGQGTNIAGFTFSNSFISGNIGVQVQDNCGTSPTTSLAVSLTNVYAVGQISGPKNVCSVLGSSATYSVAPVPGASTYNWTVPANATLVSGAGTNVVVVSFASNFTTGTLAVSVASYCGSGSTTSTLALKTLPDNPGAISGSSCIVTGTTQTFSVTPVTGATSYIWALPSGVTVQSGSGTNSVNLIFPSNFTIGTLTVTPTNACGNSITTSTKQVGVLTSPPDQIFGPIVACSYVGTSQNVTYSVTPSSDPGMTYTWGMPNGVTLVSGQGTNSINIKFNSTFVGGNLTIMAVSGCGSSPMRSLLIQKAPVSTNSISGLTNVCANTTTTYSTAAISGVSNYSWTVPANAVITNGSGTNSVTVQFNTGFTSGTISVAATSTCGTASSASLTLNCGTALVINNDLPSITRGPEINSIQVSNVTCNGMNDASIKFSINGGKEPYRLFLNGIESNNLTKLSGLTAGDYELKVVDADGKSSKEKVTISEPEPLEVKPLIVKVPSSSNSNDAKAVLSVSGGNGNYSFNWLDFEGLNDSELQNVSSGNYEVLVKDENGCAVQSVVKIASDNSNDNLINAEIPLLNIYPVPAQNELNIELINNLEEQYLMRIMTIDGKVVFNEIVLVNHDEKINLNCSNWLPGNYFVLLYDKDGSKVYVREIVIQH